MARPQGEIAYAERNKRSGVSRPAYEPLGVREEPRSRLPSFLAPGPHAFAPLPGGLRRSAKMFSFTAALVYRQCRSTSDKPIRFRSLRVMKKGSV